MKPLLALATCALWFHSSFAAPTAAPVRAEIDALLGRLESSGCQFNRNGTWYTGAEAKQHLLRKLEYVENRGTIATTEQFIQLAAAKSSTSGKPYRVRCSGEAPVESQQWLTRQLTLIRAATGQGKP